jgi:hypothetical protein
VSVWTNWDPLEEVIVGDCYAPGALDWFIEPKLQESFNAILAETKQDLDNLAQLLQNLGVQVYRPRVYRYQQSINLGSFSVNCPMSPIVPRDQYLVYGNTVYQTYTSMTDRFMDSRSYYDIFKALFDQGHNWISQPVPNLQPLSDSKWGADGGNFGKMVYKKLYQKQLLWHTATMFKCGDKLITNVQGPGSQLGLEWMRRNLPTDTVVENTGTTMRNWGHIDHGFFMINDDTVICADREFVPECLRDKTLHEVYQYLPKQIIAADTPIASLLDPSKGYEQAVLFDTNVLVVDAHNVIFDNDMPELFEFLDGIGIKSHRSIMRHRDFWAAGIHCVTLDIKRRGNKRKIVNEI